YISPERLMGRRYDQRSDIFALGILLLQCFYSEEDWNVDPSLPALQQLIAKCSNLNDFWAKLIAQMTSLEPTQRCESADEVWRRLLPISASRNFLYFPPPAYRTVGTEMFDGACRTLLVKSPSSIELSRYESSVLSIAWEQNWTTCRFDFRSRSLEDYLAALHRVMLEESPTDFYSCVQNLQAIQTERKILILLSIDAGVSSEIRSQVAFAIATLSNGDGFRIVATFSGGGMHLDVEDCKKIYLPLADKQSGEEILQSIVPFNQETQKRVEKIKTNPFSTLEQIYGALRKELPAEGFVYWPASARSYSLPPVLERVKPRDMRIMSYIAVAGGSLSVLRLAQVLDTDIDRIEVLLNQLEIQGYVHRSTEEVNLTITAESVLNRLRKARIKDLAAKLLEFSQEDESNCKYRLARLAGKRRLAASLALRLARSYRDSKGKDASMKWFLNSFCNGALLPKMTLFKLLKYNLHRLQFGYSRKIFLEIRKRFGLSYRLGDLYLEYEQRTNNLVNAELLCTRLSERASQKRHKRASQYFVVRMAGFLILQHRFNEGEKILKSINLRIASSNVRGLTHHFLGLSKLLRGCLVEALSEFRLALRFKHCLRPNSAMDLGTTLGRLGCADRGEQWLNRSIEVYS